jgi:hypothetical protein
MVKNGMVKGMEINSKAALSTPCEPCLKGKQTHAEIYKTTDTCTNTVLGRVFSDVCGKLATRSHRGFNSVVPARLGPKAGALAWLETAWAFSNLGPSQSPH